jgi:hypothetical protein
MVTARNFSGIHYAATNLISRSSSLVLQVVPFSVFVKFPPTQVKDIVNYVMGLPNHT